MACYVLAGQSAWAGLVTRWTNDLGGALLAVRISADLLGPIAAAFRLELATMLGLVAIALLVGLRRLLPVRALS